MPENNPRRDKAIGKAHRSRRRILIVGAIALGVSLALAACSASPTPVASKTPAKTSIVIATPSAPNHFVYDAGSIVYPGIEIGQQTNSTLLVNPYKTDAKDKTSLDQQVYDFTGSLAKSYHVSADGLTYTFDLRKGVKSQAGNPFTADDVIWSFEEKFQNPTAIFKNVSKPAVTDFSQFKKVNDSTVQITIADKGYGPTVLSLLSNVTTQIYDSKLLMSHATAADPFGIQWARANPLVGIGYGPYEVTAFTPGGDTTLTANPNYFGAKPAIKTVTYKVIPDSATRAQALRNGDVDVAENLTSQDQSDAAAASGVKVFDTKTNIYSVMVSITNKAPFNNTAVRQAMEYAVPYSEILQNVYLGRATKPVSFLDTSAPGYTAAGLPDYKYNVTKAKAMLAAAGYPDGVSFALTVSTDTPDLVAAAVLIQAQAKAAGFNITINQQPSAAFAVGEIAGTYQAMLVRQQAITITPPYELNLYTGNGSPLNLAKWQDPKFYALEATASAAGDPLTTKAGKLYNKANQYLLQQAPFIYFASVLPSYAVANDVDGWAWRSDNWLDLSKLKFS